MAAASLVDGIASAWRRERGGSFSITDSARLSSGASAETILLDAVADGRPLRLVVQCASEGQPFGAALGRHEQARIQDLAWRCGVPTPEVLLRIDERDGCPPGFVTKHCAGETLGRRIVTDPELSAARLRLTGQCAAALARIHGLPMEEAGWLPYRDARAQLDQLAAMHHGYGDVLPVFEVALAWLARRVPAEAGTCVVHGDFRNGNLIVDQDGLVAVLDWELAHRGDFHADLAWLCLPAWRFGAGALAVGGFGDREQLYSAYEAASGRVIDRDRLRFWEVLGTLKWGVICQWFGRQYLRGETRQIERLAIGRRISEVELDLLDLIEGIE
jgi:aminoglycoside phosphotransferase (APT) family kinase protein